ncbi:helix-turn-helix transcriptional regulator [Streptomyces rimosus]|uniref:helix-turn-helix transcriptional regulator n=1 Tax=Streptomyces rimosus TaxID=1927 RepID=UPI0031CF7B59
MSIDLSPPSTAEPITPARLNALRAVAARARTPLERAVRDLVREVDRMRAQAALRPYVRPTQRQLEVLLGAANGEQVRDTAARLSLTTDCVRTHRHHAYRRMRARNSTHAVALAMAAGMIRPGQIRLPGGELP